MTQVKPKKRWLNPSLQNKLTNPRGIMKLSNVLSWSYLFQYIVFLKSKNSSVLGSLYKIFEFVTMLKTEFSFRSKNSPNGMMKNYTKFISSPDGRL